MRIIEKNREYLKKFMELVKIEKVNKLGALR